MSCGSCGKATDRPPHGFCARCRAQVTRCCVWYAHAFHCCAVSSRYVRSLWAPLTNTSSYDTQSSCGREFVSLLRRLWARRSSRLPRRVLGDGGLAARRLCATNATALVASFYARNRNTHAEVAMGRRQQSRGRTIPRRGARSTRGGGDRSRAASAAGDGLSRGMRTFALRPIPAVRAVVTFPRVWGSVMHFHRSVRSAHSVAVSLRQVDREDGPFQMHRSRFPQRSMTWTQAALKPCSFRRFDQRGAFFRRNPD